MLPMIPDLYIKSIILTAIVESLTSARHNAGVGISVEPSKILESSIICWWTNPANWTTSVTIYDATIEISIEVSKILKLGVYCYSTGWRTNKTT